jgi:hypothetical protein
MRDSTYGHTPQGPAKEYISAMGRIVFWQLLLDDKLSYWEAQRINEASDAADIAQAHAFDASQASNALASRLEVMSREIVMLRTALTVLTQTLKDTKVLDERLLDARLEAAMELAFPKPAPQPAPTPPEDLLYTCLRCRKQVRAGTTLMTADGPVCESRCSP